ncbi:hypothetical protein ACVOMV_31080 [Mesorhizobium atlanticum]
MAEEGLHLYDIRIERHPAVTRQEEAGIATEDNIILKDGDMLIRAVLQ